MRKIVLLLLLSVMCSLPGIALGNARVALASETSTRTAEFPVTGATIVERARQYIGSRYSARGFTPDSGFSAMGLVSFVYRMEGVEMPRTIKHALALAPDVDIETLQPGDVLFFQNTVHEGLSHAGIYIGDGKFIHAEWFHTGVRISSLKSDVRDGDYWSLHVLAANRPLARFRSPKQ